MRPGFLSIETDPEPAGTLRLVQYDQAPEPFGRAPDQPRIRYVTRLSDLDAGMMHVHEILKRHLLDPDTHRYRVDPSLAIAAAESLDLKHQRTYLDADFGPAEQAQIEALTTELVQRHERWAMVFRGMGYFGIGLLLFNLFFLSFR